MNEKHFFLQTDLGYTLSSTLLIGDLEKVTESPGIRHISWGPCGDDVTQRVAGGSSIQVRLSPSFELCDLFHLPMFSFHKLTLMVGADVCAKSRHSSYPPPPPPAPLCS